MTGKGSNPMDEAFSNAPVPKDGVPNSGGPIDGVPQDWEAREGSWSRVDFEDALPLHVGGDLEPGDAALVEAWIATHPEDGALLAAARASRGLLEDHARGVRSRPVPDLWPSVRVELARSGAFTVDAPSHELLPERSIPAVAAERRVQVERGQSQDQLSGRVLGGAAWFRRRSVAAAAAVLLATSVGLMISRGGGEATVPNGAEVALEGSPATFTGGLSNVRLVGTGTQVRGSGTQIRRTQLRRGAPLRRQAGANAVHLIDLAPLVPLWQAGVVPTVEVVPLDVLMQGEAGAALAGGR